MVEKVFRPVLGERLTMDEARLHAACLKTVHYFNNAQSIFISLAYIGKTYRGLIKLWC